eukprot:8887286-Pyramimonas_sp.AAC.1
MQEIRRGGHRETTRASMRHVNASLLSIAGSWCLRPGSLRLLAAASTPARRAAYTHRVGGAAWETGDTLRA